MLTSYTIKRTVRLYLIKPSNYDDAGYVVTYFRGVLPSNTLNCVAALTREVIEKKLLGNSIDLQVQLFDETVQRIPVKRICRAARKGLLSIVCLVGVETIQESLQCENPLPLCAGCQESGHILRCRLGRPKALSPQAIHAREDL